MTIGVVDSHNKAPRAGLGSGTNNPCPIAVSFLIGVGIAKALGSRTPSAGQYVNKRTEVSWLGADFHPPTSFWVNCAAISDEKKAIA